MRGPRYWAAASLAIVFALSCVSCGERAAPKCPSEIIGYAGRLRSDKMTGADPYGSLAKNGFERILAVEDETLQFGQGKGVLTAYIGDVNVECFATPGAKKNPQGDWTFNVSATARIAREVIDSVTVAEEENAPYGGYNAELRFQLVSKQGVVLRETTSQVHFTASEAEPTVSAEFTELPLGLMERARAVQAFWIYTR